MKFITYVSASKTKLIFCVIELSVTYFPFQFPPFVCFYSTAELNVKLTLTSDC